MLFAPTATTAARFGRPGAAPSDARRTDDTIAPQDFALAQADEEIGGPAGIYWPQATCHSIRNRRLLSQCYATSHSHSQASIGILC
jgi:hypothetical protein